MVLSDPLVPNALDQIDAQIKAMMEQVHLPGDGSVKACDDGTLCEHGVSIGTWSVEAGQLKIDLRNCC